MILAPYWCTAAASFSQPGMKVFVIAAHVTGQVGIGGLDGHDLGDDEAHAALGARRVVVDERVGHVAVIGKVGGHGRHEHAVLDLLRTDLDGAEQHWVSLGFHESPLFRKAKTTNVRLLPQLL